MVTRTCFGGNRRLPTKSAVWPVGVLQAEREDNMKEMETITSGGVGSSVVFRVSPSFTQSS